MVYAHLSLGMGAYICSVDELIHKRLHFTVWL